MEYCAGGSVADIISVCKTTLNEYQIQKICYDTLKGLDYIHTKNQIHRDVKAANIVMDKFGVAKLGNNFILYSLFFTLYSL